MMDASTIFQLTVALTAVAATLALFNGLLGAGPRGTIWLVAAAFVTWGTMLPIALRDPDGGGLTSGFDLLVTVLQLCGIIGLLLGIVDLAHQRRGDAAHAIAHWAVRQPLLWGLIVCANFYALLFNGTIYSPLLWRYCAGHPVEIVEAAFFFVGLAILLLRFTDVAGQIRSLSSVSFGLVPPERQRVADCGRLLAGLAALPARMQDTYLVRRLREALQFVGRRSSAEGLEEHLRHLEELDAIRMHSGYATLRIIVWAIPILGFLGTVIGITVAIANLSPNALEQSMSEVTQGLGVAFDTTAEALALTMVLMFAKSLVERLEDRLLAAVDTRVSEELIGRFEATAPADDPNVATIRRMSEQVLHAVEALATRQTHVWRTAIDETHQQWADVSIATGQIVKNSLASALRDNLETHARVLGQNVLKHADRLEASADRHVDRLERSSHGTAARLREGLEQLGELLVGALERHGQVLTASERELHATIQALAATLDEAALRAQVSPSDGGMPTAEAA